MADDATADDLRSLLSKSFDDAQSSTALSDGVVKQPDPPEVEPKTGDVDTTDAKSAAERARDASGKFAKKDDAEPKGDLEPKAKDGKDGKAEPDPKAEAKAGEGDEPKADDKAKPDGKEPPSNWPASDKAMFKLQSPEAQQFLLRRVASIEADYTKKTQAIADLKTNYEPVQQLFQPYLDTLKQKGLTPHTVIQRWADVETKLANGGESAMAIVAGIVQGYNIDRAALAQKLGLSTARAAEAPADGTAPPADDPVAQQLKALEDRIRQSFAPQLAEIENFKQQQQHAQLTAAQQREAEVESRITNFKSAKDAQGQLQHPYFDEVEPAMIALASSYVASKQPVPDLDQLYETAVWANPSTRSAILAAQKAAEKAQIAEEARAKAASARRAGSSVTGAPGSGQSTRQVRGEQSLREQLEEAAADLG